MENRLNRARIGSGRVLGPLNGLTLAVLIVSLVLSSCTTVNQTPGQRFRELMQRMAEICVEKNLPPTDSRCVLPKLEPADPLSTSAGKFAHSLVIPDPIQVENGFKSGMSPKEYFEHLCETEAGEFIYKTVEGVESVFQLRPRDRAGDRELEHLYAMEDPYGYTNGEAIDPEFMYVSENRYRYFERALSRRPGKKWKMPFRHESFFVSPRPEDKYERYYGYNNKDMKTMKLEFSAERKSRYGYTWRGIVRPQDREMGIAGGELIVVDLNTKEVLGVRRGFVRSGNVRNLTGVWWPVGETCPSYDLRGGRNKDFDFSYWFIGKVLRPRNYASSFEELRHGK